MIFVGLHAYNLIPDKLWADLKPMLENLIYPLKGFKINIGSRPQDYQDIDGWKSVVANVKALMPKGSKLSLAIPILTPDNQFISTTTEANKAIDRALNILGELPAWFLINEPYNYKDKNGNKISYELMVKVIKMIEVQISRKRLNRELYLGDCPDEWEMKGWYELKNLKGKLYPKCVHLGVTMPSDKGYGSIIRNGRLLRSGCKVVCDEASVYDYETMPEYEDFEAWENPAHNWRRAITALAGSIFNDFCWWALFFHTNSVGQSVGLMTNTPNKKNPQINPILRYFVKKEAGGIGTG